MRAGQRAGGRKSRDGQGELQGWELREEKAGGMGSETVGGPALEPDP